MKEFKIIFDAEASFDEVTDSIADVFGIGIVIEKTLADGFQLTDILAAIQLEPKVREVINDFPVFIEQFKNAERCYGAPGGRSCQGSHVERIWQPGQDWRFCVQPVDSGRDHL
jgi:hypothetical protein